MRLRPALLAALAIGCHGAVDTLRTVADATAVLANAGGVLVLRERCATSMAAIGRTGTLADGRCVESGPRAGMPATDAETVALAAVRVARQPVMDAAEAVRAAHDAAAVLLAAGALDDLPRALVTLATAYGRLVALAATVGLALPTTTAEVTP